MGEEGYGLLGRLGWLGPLPNTTSICYCCPTPNSFTSTNAIFRALKPPTQLAILLGSLHMFPSANGKSLSEIQLGCLTSTHLLHLAWWWKLTGRLGGPSRDKAARHDLGEHTA